MVHQGKKDNKAIWINCGETSGDQHGAMLMRVLRRKGPGIRFLGMGGQALRSQGFEALIHSEELSVMGFTEVLAHIVTIINLLGRVRKELEQNRPDLVVLIDAPEFNFRVARMAHELSIPVVYYISPKIWAWRTKRVRFIQRYVKDVICILPFEEEFFARHGVRVHYVGHPMVDTVRTDSIMAVEPEENRIGILPGSRIRELTSLLPVFGETARLLRKDHPDLTFHLVKAPGIDVNLVRLLWPTDVPLSIVHHEDRYQTIRSCRAIMAASGTVTLETGLLETPTVVCYRFSPLTAFLARRLIKVPYASLTNLILKEEVFPELLQEKLKPESIANHIHTWLADTSARNAMEKKLRQLPDILGPGGAVDRAAEIILSRLS